MLTPQMRDELDRRGRPPLADADEDEAGRYGMRTDEDDGDVEDEGDDVMRLVCDTCGEVSRVLPPKGFTLALRMGEEGEEDEAGPRGVRYTCGSCGETNRAAVPRGYALRRATESVAVRAFRESYRGAGR